MLYLASSMERIVELRLAGENGAVGSNFAVGLLGGYTWE